VALSFTCLAFFTWQGFPIGAYDRGIGERRAYISWRGLSGFLLLHDEC